MLRPHALWPPLLASLLAGAAHAQEVVSAASAPSAAHVHVGHIASSYADTPGGLGLLAIATAEVEVAVRHAELAVGDSLDLEGMKRHGEHVLHALDPSLVPEGPGRGYGLGRAAAGIVQHIELAGAAEGASENVRTHAAYIAGAAQSARQRLDRVVALADRLRSAISAAAALSVARELEAATRALWLGSDADRDGRVAWASPEGGVRQILYHMTLLRRGEGLIQEGRSR